MEYPKREFYLTHYRGEGEYKAYPFAKFDNFEEADNMAFKMSNNKNLLLNGVLHCYEVGISVKVKNKYYAFIHCDRDILKLTAKDKEENPDIYYSCLNYYLGPIGNSYVQGIGPLDDWGWKVLDYKTATIWNDPDKPEIKFTDILKQYNLNLIHLDNC